MTADCARVCLNTADHHGHGKIRTFGSADLMGGNMRTSMRIVSTFYLPSSHRSMMAAICEHRGLATATRARDDRPGLSATDRRGLATTVTTVAIMVVAGMPKTVRKTHFFEG